MKRKGMAIVLAVACFVLAGPAWAGRYVPGEALVVFRDAQGQRTTAASLKGGLDSFRVASLAASAGARVARTWGELSEASGRGAFALLRSDTKGTEELVAELLARDDVLAASPNWIQRAMRIPNDPGYALLWGMGAIRAPEAWDTTTGSADVCVAVVDSGVDGSHPDLAKNFDATHSRNFWSEPTAPPVPTAYGDENGHGTHVAGTIGAAGDDGIGVAGVSWGAKIISLRVLGPDGSGPIDATIDALEHVMSLLQAEPGLAAVNLSLGTYAGIAPTLANVAREPYWLAMWTLSEANRAVIVVAAGNEGLEVGAPAPRGGEYWARGDYGYPASFPGIGNMIVVGAASADAWASFSNWSSSKVDVAAPGTGIVSSLPAGLSAANDAEYGAFSLGGVKLGTSSGTSMAAPHVAGAAALLRAAYPDATAYQIKMAILNGADGTRFRTQTARGMLDVKGALDWLATHPEQLMPPEVTPPDEPVVPTTDTSTSRTVIDVPGALARGEALRFTVRGLYIISGSTAQMTDDDGALVTVLNDYMQVLLDGSSVPYDVMGVGDAATFVVPWSEVPKTGRSFSLRVRAPTPEGKWMTTYIREVTVSGEGKSSGGGGGGCVGLPGGAGLLAGAGLALLRRRKAS